MMSHFRVRKIRRSMKGEASLVICRTSIKSLGVRACTMMDSTIRTTTISMDLMISMVLASLINAALIRISIQMP